MLAARETLIDENLRILKIVSFENTRKSGQPLRLMRTCGSLIWWHLKNYRKNLGTALRL
jgi:hypothetical protein